MTASFEVSRRAGRSIFHADTLRLLLLTALREQTASFAQHAATYATLAANPSDDLTGRDRAMAAIHLYCARQAIEEIEEALARIEDGGPPSLPVGPGVRAWAQVAASTSALRPAVCPPQQPRELPQRTLEKAHGNPTAW